MAEIDKLLHGWSRGNITLTQALHVKFIFFIFSLSRPKLSPLIHCLHLAHSTKNSSPTLSTFSTTSLTHFSQTNNSNSNKQSTYISFSQNSLPNIVSRQKNDTQVNPPCNPNRFKHPKYPLPIPTTDTTQITNYSQNGQDTRHTANPSITCVIVEN